MTYRQLYTLLNGLFTDEQLDDVVKVKDIHTDAMYIVDTVHRGTGSHDNYDGNTYLTFSLFTFIENV